MRTSIETAKLPVAERPQGRLHLILNGFMCAGSAVASLSSQRSSATVYLAASPEDFKIETADQSLDVGAALVLPGVLKRVSAQGGPLMYFDIFPTHRAFRQFATLPGVGMRALPREHFAELVPALGSFHSGELSSDESEVLFERVIERASALLPEVPPLDPRVRQVKRLLRDGQRRSVEELADAACMSKDWLSHLFRREVGISLRKYDQSLKLQTAAGHLGRSLNLTEIAAIAGFADSAHLSKVWKEHFGLPPTWFFASKSAAVDPTPQWPCLETLLRGGETTRPTEPVESPEQE